MTLTVTCPTCKNTVRWSDESKFRPFCCERCKLIDLGDWAAENHKISQPLQGTDLTEDMLDEMEAQVLQNHKFFVEPE
jgi:uncharacterized protein